MRNSVLASRSDSYAPRKEEEHYQEVHHEGLWEVVVGRPGVISLDREAFVHVIYRHCMEN
jgi:hypothetical protein